MTAHGTTPASTPASTPGALIDAVRRVTDRMPRRTRIGVLVAVAVILGGLLLRPLLAQPHHTSIAPAAPIPLLPAGAPSALEVQADRAARVAATRALACPPRAPGAVCGTLHISTLAVLPAPDTTAADAAARRVMVVEIVGHLTTTAPAAGPAVPIALRVTVTRTATGWSSTVTHA